MPPVSRVQALQVWNSSGSINIVPPAKVKSGTMIPPPLLTILALAALAAAASSASAADAGRSRIGPRSDCAWPVRCRRPPGPPDRDARPFEGTARGALGRPCGIRWRYTPSGPLRVRVCF